MCGAIDTCMYICACPEGVRSYRASIGSRGIRCVWSCRCLHTIYVHICPEDIEVLQSLHREQGDTGVCGTVDMYVRMYTCTCPEGMRSYRASTGSRGIQVCVVL